MDVSAAVGVDLDQGAGAGAVARAGNKYAGQQALDLQAYAGLGQLGIGGALRVGEQGEKCFVVTRW